MSDNVWTIGALLRWTTEYLGRKQIDSPRLDAEVLLAHVLGCRRIDLYVRSEELAGDAARTQFRSLIERRVNGSPVAYLVGRKEFFLLPFEVTPAVLIPRPSTESLVLTALERLRTHEAPSILDLGTGSGCIAVALAVRLKNARIVAVDREAAALDVARRNAAANGVSERIDLRCGHLFDPVGDQQFDAIVSNPPYIPTPDIAGLSPDVRDHEPRGALDGGPDGLDVIRAIVAGAGRQLKPRGWLLLEFGAGQDSAVRDLVRAAGNWSDVTVSPDADGIPRVLSARWTG